MRRAAFAAVFAIAFAPCLEARADEASDTSTARSLGIDGVTLADSGRCREAIEKLERAEKLHHAPTTATRLGECEIEIGRLVVGTERLQRVVREPLAANAHPAFAAAVARAQRDLEAAVPRIATLHVSVLAPVGVKPSLAVDDESVTDAALETDRRIDPGTHKIQVSARGYITKSASATLGDGETKNVAVELVVDPNAPIATNESTRFDSNTSANRETHGSKAPAIVAFSIAALGLGVGIYAGAVTGEKASTLSSQCGTDHVCTPDMRSDITDAKRWATASTIGFATAGAGVATGVVLLLLSGGSSGTTSGKRAVRPTVGIGSVGLDGRF